MRGDAMKKICKPCTAVFIGGLMCFVLLFAYWLNEEEKCQSMGGMYMRGVLGFSCVDVKELK